MFSRKKFKDVSGGDESRYSDVRGDGDGMDPKVAHMLEEEAMRDKWENSHRNRIDSGHDLLENANIKGPAGQQAADRAAAAGGGGGAAGGGAGSGSRSRWGQKAPKKGAASKDAKRAAALFAAGKVEESAGLGHAVAMGVMSERFYFGEDGCPVDPEVSTSWAVKAAAAGDRVGQFRLAWAYQYGEGGLTVDFRQATAWFKRAAEQGCEASMNNLGYLYKRGGNGILRDMPEAIFWFRRGAEAGDIYAQDNLGACYRNGVGVEANLDHARFWFQKASDGGNAEAQSALGTMYVTGQGGVEDFATGFALWQSSAAAGEETAAENLDALRRLVGLQKWRVP